MNSLIEFERGEVTRTTECIKCYEPILTNAHAIYFTDVNQRNTGKFIRRYLCSKHFGFFLSRYTFISYPKLKPEEIEWKNRYDAEILELAIR